MRQNVPMLMAAPLALVACGRPAQDPRTLPPLVGVAVARADGESSQDFAGVVRARIESDLGFRVGGKIAERFVDVGQSVRKGQPILRLDTSDLSLESAAQVSTELAARARSAQADADLGRLKGLVEQGAVSPQTYDEAKALADSARAQLAAAHAQSRLAANARGYSTLAADSDGVVEALLAEPGQVVAPGQIVVRLARAGPREAAVDLPETVRPALGSNAIATLYGDGTAPISASLRQLSQNADPSTRTYEARYVLEGAAANAPLGATVTVTLLGKGARAGVRAPLGAIYDPGTGPGVWLLRGDKVAFLPVRIAGMNADSAVVEGVEVGSRIVGIGADRLREGQQVRPVAMPGSSATRGPAQ